MQESKKGNEHKDNTKRTFNIWWALKWNQVDQCVRHSASTAIIGDVLPSRVRWCQPITTDLYCNGYDGDPGTLWLYKQRECVWHCVYVWKDPVACCDDVAWPSLDINSPNEGKSLGHFGDRMCSLGPVPTSELSSIRIQLYKGLNRSIDWLAVFAMEDVTRGELLKARCW